MKCWKVIWTVVLFLSIIGGCAKAQPLFHAVSLPGSSIGSVVPAIQRQEVFAPLRYRVIVIPGSGCGGLASVADRYFSGLLHAEVLVLHKPGTDIHSGLNPSSCSADFVKDDALSLWLEHARAALRFDALTRIEVEPVAHVLVGISEGVEILASLAEDIPNLAGVILISGSGLDPVVSGEMQAKRSGELAAWKSVEKAQLSNCPDDDQIQGRTLRYWRDMWRWRVEQPLINANWPLVQIWGDADASIPPDAFTLFSTHAANRKAQWCSVRIRDTDHGLQSPSKDGIQKSWGWLENWARQPGSKLCAHMPSSP